MRILVSCQKICAPNHAQVQLSVGVLNGWLGSDYIHQLIQKTTNLLYYHWRLYYCLNHLISEYLPRDWQNTLASVNNKKILFYTKVLFSSTFKSTYLKYFKYLQSGRKFKPSISNDMWPNVSRSKVRSYFIYFWLCTWIIFCFFSYVEIVHLLWRLESVVIYYKLIPYWIESTTSRILFTALYRTKSEILLGEVLKK